MSVHPGDIMKANENIDKYCNDGNCRRALCYLVRIVSFLAADRTPLFSFIHDINDAGGAGKGKWKEDESII